MQVFGEGRAKEGSVDEDVEWDGRTQSKHRLGVEDLGEVVTTDICHLLAFSQTLQPELDRCTCRNEQNPLALIKLKVLLLRHKVDLDLSTGLVDVSILHRRISHYNRIASIQFEYGRSMKLFGRGRRDILVFCYQNPYPSRLKCARNFSTESFRVRGETISAVYDSLVRLAVRKGARLTLSSLGPTLSHSPETSRLSRYLRNRLHHSAGLSYEDSGDHIIKRSSFFIILELYTRMIMSSGLYPSVPTPNRTSRRLFIVRGRGRLVSLSSISRRL